MSYHCRETQRILSDFGGANCQALSVVLMFQIDERAISRSTLRSVARSMTRRTNPDGILALPTTSLLRTTARWLPMAKTRPAFNSTDRHIGLDLFPYRHCDGGKTFVLTQVSIPLYPRIAVAVRAVHIQQFGFSFIFDANVMLWRQSAVNRE